MPVENRENFVRELDLLTEIEIRDMIERGAWDAEKRKIAEEYLFKKEAAWHKLRSADVLSLARRSNLMATIALLVAILSLIYSARHALKPFAHRIEYGIEKVR